MSDQSDVGQLESAVETLFPIRQLSELDLSNKSEICWLPQTGDEIIISILEFLSSKELVCFRLVSKAFATSLSPPLRYGYESLFANSIKRHYWLLDLPGGQFSPERTSAVLSLHQRLALEPQVALVGGSTKTFDHPRQLRAQNQSVDIYTCRAAASESEELPALRVARSQPLLKFQMSTIRESPGIAYDAATRSLFIVGLSQTSIHRGWNDFANLPHDSIETLTLNHPATPPASLGGLSRDVPPEVKNDILASASHLDRGGDSTEGSVVRKRSREGGDSNDNELVQRKKGSLSKISSPSQAHVLLPRLSQPVCYAAAAFYRPSPARLECEGPGRVGHLFVSGGCSHPFRGARVFESFARLQWHPRVSQSSSLSDSSWGFERLPNMQVKRCGHLLVVGRVMDVLQPVYIYAIGGYSGGNSYQASVERFLLHDSLTRTRSSSSSSSSSSSNSTSNSSTTTCQSELKESECLTAPNIAATPRSVSGTQTSQNANHEIIDLFGEPSLVRMMTVVDGHNRDIPVWVEPTQALTSDANSEKEPHLDRTLGTSGHAWEMVAPMKFPRSGAGAGIGPDARLYVFGGSLDGSQMTRHCERYDPASNSWEDIAPLPIGIGYIAGAFCADGKYYIVSGMRSTQKGLSNTLVYDPLQNSWREVPSMPRPRVNAAATFCL